MLKKLIIFVCVFVLTVYVGTVHVLAIQTIDTKLKNHYAKVISKGVMKPLPASAMQDN